MAWLLYPGATRKTMALVLGLAFVSSCSSGSSNRPSTDLRAHIGPMRTVPSDCWQVWSDRRAAIRDFEKRADETGEYNWTKDYRIVTQYAIFAEAESTRGSVSTALFIVNKAIASTANVRQLITLYASKGLMLSAIGATEDAKEEFGLSVALIGDARKVQERYRFFVYLAQGFIGAGDRKYKVAESNLRSALALVTDRFFYLRLDETVDLNYVRSVLVDILVKQGRLGDAELAAREAILRKPHYLESEHYSASAARIWNRLANIYFKMEHFKDAEFAINVSLNMLGHDCAHPRSNIFRDARSIEWRVKARLSDGS